MKKFFDEFKKFIERGNVIDLAVGVLIGGVDFSNLSIKLMINIQHNILLEKQNLIMKNCRYNVKIR